MSSPTKGNDPQRWEKFLESLDEKLQLGLLDQLRKIASYHFEEDVLYVIASSVDQRDYLSKESVFQQLELLAQDAIKVDRVKIKPPVVTPLPPEGAAVTPLPPEGAAVTPLPPEGAVTPESPEGAEGD